MSTEPALMSLVAVAKAIASKEVSAREVTKSCLDRIAQRLGALVPVVCLLVRTAQSSQIRHHGVRRIGVALHLY